MTDTKTLEDAWAKEQGITLVRDSCEACKSIQERGKNSLGQTRFCSQAHAHEVSGIKRNRHYESMKARILAAINTDVLSLDDARQIISDIEERYY